MTYEEYLDEVTTLIYERYGVSEAQAIKHVMQAQAAGYFSPHDDHPEMRTPERAAQDAKTVFDQHGMSAPKAAPKRSAKRK